MKECTIRQKGINFIFRNKERRGQFFAALIHASAHFLVVLVISTKMVSEFKDSEYGRVEMRLPPVNLDSYFICIFNSFIFFTLKELAAADQVVLGLCSPTQGHGTHSTLIRDRYCSSDSVLTYSSAFSVSMYLLISNCLLHHYY